jgi:hypothetical protein
MYNQEATNMLNADDQKIQDLLKAWQTNQVTVGRLKDMPKALLDSHTYTAIAKQRTKFIALDMGGSGHFLVDRKTERVYSIKAYGVPNLKKDRGTVEYLTKFINDLTAQGKEYTHNFWYSLHPVD